MEYIHDKNLDSLDDIFNKYQYEIYNQILNSIQLNYQNFKIDSIKVVSISTSNSDYSISLSSDKFISSLESCIKFFESIEDYEKCQSCLNIINDIKNKLELKYDARENS